MRTGWEDTSLNPGNEAHTVVSNSQCAIDITDSQTAISGNQLSLTVPVTFQSSFSGSKNIYLIGDERQHPDPLFPDVVNCNPVVINVLFTPNNPLNR